MQSFGAKAIGWVSDVWGRLTGFARGLDRFQETPKSSTTFQRLDRLLETMPEAEDATVEHQKLSVAPIANIDSSTLIYAIGDVHGRADLLDRLISIIDQDSGQAKVQPHLVFLGDYIDRGFQSRQVIQRLCELSEESRYQTVFLKGNHEQAMTTFLSDYKIGPDWAAFGGRETLISYGVMPPKSITALDEWQRVQAGLHEKLPSEHLEFLSRLQTHHRIGPYGFVHAGVRPGIPFDKQNDEDRLWIRDAFLSSQEKEDLIIVHGHSPVDAPFMDHRRINVDTGAYFTGRLSAVRLTDTAPEFISNLSVSNAG